MVGLVAPLICHRKSGKGGHRQPLSSILEPVSGVSMVGVWVVGASEAAWSVEVVGASEAA
jgi:hypothetical protein